MTPASNEGDYAVDQGYQDHALEDAIKPPLSVLIHGDFNVDNIIFDESLEQIRFVDLHRSELLDYVQDISVFLVSNYRLQVFDAPIRNRIQSVISAFLEFACKFAEASGDKTFQTRLALGLARSFITSSRFVLDEEFAKSMFLRSRYLLEQVGSLKNGGVETFKVPREVLND